MAKTIVVSDKVFHWLTNRAGPQRTVALVLAEVIATIDKHERDLEKYHAWIDASAKTPALAAQDELPKEEPA